MTKPLSYAMQDVLRNAQHHDTDRYRIHSLTNRATRQALIDRGLVVGYKWLTDAGIAERLTLLPPAPRPDHLRAWDAVPRESELIEQQSVGRALRPVPEVPADVKDWDLERQPRHIGLDFSNQSDHSAIAIVHMAEGITIARPRAVTLAKDAILDKARAYSATGLNMELSDTTRIYHLDTATELFKIAEELQP